MSRLSGPVALPVSMFVVTLMLIVAHQGKLLELSYTPMAFLVAWRLYRRYPAHYLGFVCWLFFLSPEVRRFADFFNSTFNEKSMIMVAPVLASLISFMAVVTHYRILGQRRAMPLLLIMAALMYAYVVGIVRVGVAPASYTFVNWMFPVVVAFRLVVTWQEYPTYHRVLLKTFVYGTAVMGAYGVYQYISPPPWDAFWLVASGMTSSGGNPVPFGMRVFSTMNSTGPFAFTIMTGLLMCLAARGKMPVVASLVGVPALLFTAVRSAWGGTIVGLIYPIAMLDGRSRMRLIAGIIGCVGLCLPLTTIDSVSEHFLARLDSIRHLSDDNSFQSRSGFYKVFLSIAVTDIAGQGLGMTGGGTKLAADPNQTAGLSLDSGLMEIPWVMGWPGTLLYLTGVVTMMWRAFVASFSRKKDRFAISGVGVANAAFAMLLFFNTMQSLAGMVFFIGIVMPVIGLRYARETRALETQVRARERARRVGQPGTGSA